MQSKAFTKSREVDDFCLNIFVQVLTIGIKNRQQLCSAGAISQKVMLERTDELFNMIVKC